MKANIDTFRTDRANALTVSFFVLLGAALRFPFLFYPATWDECFTYVNYASRPISYGLTTFGSNNHFLNTLLVHLSTRLFGNAPWAMRLYELIGGLALIAIAYFVFKRMFDDRVGLLASGLVAVSYPLITYSTVARGYMIQCVLFLAIIWIGQNLKAKSGFRQWALFVLAASTSFYVLPTSIYFVGGVVAWLLASAAVRDVASERLLFVRDLSIASLSIVVLTFLLYLPSVLKSGIHAILNDPFMQPAGLGEFFTGTGGMLADMYGFWSRYLVFFILPVLILGFVLSIVFYSRISEVRVNLALVVVLWTALVMLLHRAVIFHRVLLPLLPLFYGFAAAGLVFAGRRVKAMAERILPSIPRLKSYFLNISIAGAVVMMGIMVFFSPPAYRTRLTEQAGMETDKAALLIEENLEEGDLVYGGVFDPCLTYYFERYGVDLRHLKGNLREVPAISGEEVDRIVILSDLGGANFLRVLEEDSPDLDRFENCPEEVYSDNLMYKIMIFEKRDPEGV